MVLLIGLSLGFAALMLRSAVALACVGVLILAAFMGAWFVSGHGQISQLLTVLTAYNVGMAFGFALMLVIQKMRPVLR